MFRQSSILRIVTVGCLWVATGLGCAGKTPSTPPSATIMSVEGASTTYQTRDWNGQRVTVRAPSQSPADIKGKDAEGSARATVTAIDPAANHVQIRTAEGQTIVLEMARASRKDLQVGDPLLFTVPKPLR